MGKIVALVAAAVLCLSAAGCAPTKYQNCDAVHRVYKGGIAKPGYHQTGMVTRYAPHVDAQLYSTNAHLDRDKDGVACEA